MKKTATKNEEKTWDKIAKKWSQYRKRTPKVVEDFLKNQQGKILDLGCGTGRNFLKSKDKKYYGIDFSEEMLKLAEKNSQKNGIKTILKKSTTNKIPFKENYFNAIICYATLHCIPSKKERQKTLKEIQRTLKPHSETLISVWSRNSPRLKNKPKECFIPWTIEKTKMKRYTYIYDKEEIEREVKESGLKIIKSWQDKNINIIAQK